MQIRTLPFSLCVLAATAAAQGPIIQSPGQPSGGTGQTDRFSKDFNPAIGAVVDAVFDYTDIDSPENDGFDLSLRVFELSANAWVDPNAWMYAVIVADEDEIELEEAAVHYIGLSESATVRAGRFFVDFGKQMQAHVHDIATITRPAVLRGYLGEELAGTGVQFDNWFAVGDSTTVRYSLGVFDSLVEGHAHGEEEASEPEIESLVDERGQIDELGFTARLTALTEVGETGILQLGTSWRGIPDYTLEFDPSGAEVGGLANNVVGLDLTFGVTDETGQSGWTFGGEYLMFDGDLGGVLADPMNTPTDPSDDTLSVFDDDVSGYYVWADRAFDTQNSVGALYSAFEHPEPGMPEESELQVYYTRYLTEYSRLRFGVTIFESDDEVDSSALLVQFTNFVGAHSHGLNW